MLDEILLKGFALTNRRFGLVLLDTVWKAIWLAVTLAMFFLVVSWYGSQMQSLAWQDTGVPALNGVLAATLLREFWNANKGEIYWAIAAVTAVSALFWFFLEGFFRSRILHGTNGMRLYLASGIAKATILAGAALIFGLFSLGPYLTTPFAEWSGLWVDTRGAAIAGLVAFVALAFLLTLLDTLIRSDAIDLLGTDLIRVSSMLGILMLFEVMVAASAAIVLIAGFLNVGRMSEALVMLGVAGLAVVVLSVLHSYLLLVRFSAVDIMRRNVVEI